MADPIHFADFTLEPTAHQLRRGGAPVALQPKPFDLLVLLAANPGRLFSKNELFEKVWPGVTVGDEALTQAIKEVRKALGDDAANPRFIETVPKRGYRFVAGLEGKTATSSAGGTGELILAGTLGGGIAGLIGGSLYGLIAGLGNDAALPIFIVMLLLTTSIAMLGALGLCLGMAVAARASGQRWMFSMLGAGLGGFLVGEIFHRVASGSFSLLLGQPHSDFTGGLEGAILGALIAGGAMLGARSGHGDRHTIAGSALGGAAGGLLIALLGGKLMASSLASLARDFHGSQVNLGWFATLAGDAGGQWPLLVTAGEGALLGLCMTAAILRRKAG